DLLSRIDVLQIHISPLRERRQDIPVMIDHFTRVYGKIYAPGREVSMEPDMMKLLLAYSYPGNVREMDNILRRAFLLLSYDATNVLKSDYIMLQPAGFVSQHTSNPTDLEHCLQMIIDNLVNYIGTNLKLFRKMNVPDLPILYPKQIVDERIIREIFRATEYNKGMTARLVGMTTDQLRKYKKP
ncbi:MAG: hypothetical protein WCL06_12325, partial [Bacteroidota bacterium]